jgi:hypothetical protein
MRSNTTGTAWLRLPGEPWGEEVIERKLWPQDRARTAWHEAGHVVISQVLGVRVWGTSIMPDAQRGLHGVTGHETVLDRLDQWEDWRAGSAMKGSPYLADVLIAMAGFRAQRRRPRPKGQHSLRHPQGYRGSPDMRRVWWSLSEITTVGQDIIRRHDRLLKATDALVGRHRAAIARVAQALLTLDTLDEWQIEALVPLRRWPESWQRPTILVSREQIQELAALLRTPGQRLTAALLTRPDAPRCTFRNR